MQKFINKEAKIVHVAYSVSLMKSWLSVILGPLTTSQQQILTQPGTTSQK